MAQYRLVDRRAASCHLGRSDVGLYVLPLRHSDHAGHFRFVTVSEPDEYGGGWREVCIHAHMSQDVHGTGQVTRFTCNLGVGVPIVLHTGRHVPLHEAQSQSAMAANAAAYATLTNTVGVTARTCQKARRKMLRLLQHKISGARVNECRSVVGGVKIPVVNFP